MRHLRPHAGPWRDSCDSEALKYRGRNLAKSPHAPLVIARMRETWMPLHISQKTFGKN